MDAIFNRKHLYLNKLRAQENFKDYCFLFEDSERSLVERIQEVKIRPSSILLINAHCDILLNKALSLSDNVIVSSLMPFMTSPKKEMNARYVICDEEQWPWPENCFDMIVSCLSLHWINNLPNVLSKIYQSLKPQGFFLASLFGGETLKELRTALIESEIRLTNRATAHISPMLKGDVALNLLQRAHFHWPMVDRDLIEVHYPHLNKLLKDLKGMGENNVLAQRYGAPKQLFETAKDFYSPTTDEILATFEILYLTGWKHTEAPERHFLLTNTMA